MASTTSGGENPRKKITLKTCDNCVIEVEESVAMEFGTIRPLFEDKPDAAENVSMTLKHVTADTLEEIIAYCKKHVEFRANSTPEEEVKSFDVEFVQKKNTDKILEIMDAANFLEATNLLSFLEEVVAERIKGKSVEYVRKELRIVNTGFTADEEAALREEHAWAFKGV